MMLETIIGLIFCSTLLITGGHLMDTKLGWHHYGDEDYKEIFYLKNNDSTSKNCIRHSALEDIKKIKRYQSNNDGGEMVTAYKINTSKEKATPKS